MNELLQELIEFVKNASPIVWSVLIRQVYIEAGARLVWSVGLTVICFLLARLGNYGKKQYDDSENYSEWDIGMWFAWSGSAIAGFSAFALIVSALMWFANPEFYAIHFVIQSLTTNGR